MATQSGILAWRIPWTEEPGRLQSSGHKELGVTEPLALSHFPQTVGITLPLLNLWSYPALQNLTTPQPAALSL